MCSLLPAASRPSRPGPVALRPSRLLPATLGLLLCLALLLSVVRAVTGFVPAYRGVLHAGEAAQATDLSGAELEAALRRVIDYSLGRRADLQFTMPPHSARPGQPAFSQREIEHMVDVRELFHAVGVAAIVAWGTLGAVAAAGLVARRTGHRIDLERTWAAAGRWAAASGLGLLALAGILALADFDWFWDQFHYLFFANDLWQLPAGSLLIVMLPPHLFARLVGLVGAAWGTLLVACWLWGRRVAGRARVRH